jgi:hypothetical protein
MGSPSPGVAGRLRVLTGRVLAADEAGAQVMTRAGRIRATWGGCVLVAAASSTEALARRGDAVRLTAWPDGRVTVEQVLMRPLPARPRPAAGNEEPVAQEGPNRSTRTAVGGTPRSTSRPLAWSAKAAEPQT